MERERETKATEPGIDRREFLRRSAWTGVGLGALPLAAGALAEPPRVRRRVTLGKTGLEVPDVGFGSSRLRDGEDLVRHALDRGITHFDTAESYTRGASEETLGRALAGVREQVTLASKTHCEAGTSRQALMQALESSLRRLRTDRVEIYFNHAVNDPDRLRNDEWPEFVLRARKQGKLRFTGMSGHGGRLVECLDLALERDLADVLLVAYNFGQDPGFLERFTRDFDLIARQPELPRVLRKAREKGVGVVAMKTLRGGRLNDMRPYEGEGASFAQAALRWVLGGGLADSLVVTMRSREQVDEYLGASGWTRPHHADAALLARYETRNGSSQCRWGCHSCEAACPAGVAIADVLRAGMYARDYGDAELGRETWARLERDASPCLGCRDTPCLAACPHGVAVPELTRDAARRLGDSGA